jgi:hypothetical protein
MYDTARTHRFRRCLGLAGTKKRAQALAIVSLHIYSVVVFCVPAINLGLAVLAHHDDGRCVGSLEGKNQVQQDEGIRSNWLMNANMFRMIQMPSRTLRRRREFTRLFASGGIAATLPSRVLSDEKVPRIGGAYLAGGGEPLFDAFVDGLRNLGYSEGKTRDHALWSSGCCVNNFGMFEKVLFACHEQDRAERHRKHCAHEVKIFVHRFPQKGRPDRVTGRA